MALLTWLDVERTFKRETDNFNTFRDGILSIRSYSDGTEIEYSTNLPAIVEWLREIFGHVYQAHELYGEVMLTIGDCGYPIQFIESTVTIQAKRHRYPLWQEQTYANGQITDYPRNFEAIPTISAFHSFKGGVGRTTSLMTYASALLSVENSEQTRILLVDADLEAPGISFWLDPQNKPTVSFVHFLEAMHYPPKDTDTSLDYFAAELRKSSLNIEGVNREVFVLPAALDLAEIMDMPVQPEHIARSLDNPWLLTDYLYELGKRLKVEKILIDLRAGLSELSSPLLFDPRIEHFFVTTVAPQSVIGMSEILKTINKFQRNINSTQYNQSKPSIILNFLTPLLRQSPDYAKALQDLNAAFPSPDCDEDGGDVLTPGIEFIEAEFDPSFMSVRSVRQALELLRGSSLYPYAAEWARAVKDQERPIVDTVLSQEQDDAVKLQQICERFQFAENNSSDEMLVTDPLRNLAKYFSSSLPNAISIGAKGAGKTFTYLQLCRKADWHSFLAQLGIEDPQVDNGTIFPLLRPSNLDGESLGIVQRTEESAKLSIGSNPDTSSGNLRELINTALRDSTTDWERLWVQALFLNFNNECSTLGEFNNWLATNNKSIVFVIDGIEDTFDSLDSDENQKNAVRALLQLPNQLNDISNRRIGLVAFVRADYINATIRQNVGQFISRFQAFQLVWSSETFLRLAYWICGKANIIGATPEDADKLSSAQLLSKLELLWGKKMGNNSSKEALTARWVFAALCDLNGRLQARDIVRFLKFASQNMSSTRGDTWKDRVLAPEAIRKSLADCSIEKVEEATSEVAALRKLQTLLGTLNSDVKKSPFSVESIPIPIDLLSSLRELGVIYEDTDQGNDAERFYLPEIYRTGLGFRSAIGGRPRIQALLKRNLGGMPF